MITEIFNGRVLLEDGTLSEATLLLEDDRVVEIGTRAIRPDTRLNAAGMLVLPGIVDLHGDGFERQLMPRPEVFFSHEQAFHETDRQMVANGITTAYHGLTYSWEPGLRGAQAAREFLRMIHQERNRLICDTKLHLRFETHNLAAVEEVVEWIFEGKVDLLAFNDHTECFWNELEIPRYVTVFESRTGLSKAEYKKLLEQVRIRGEQVPGVIGKLAAAARSRGIPMASHDDETPGMRQKYHVEGCAICEFPVSMETARAAKELGNPVVLGAPNVLRGKSQSTRRVSAREALTHGVCDILTTDYYYPAPLLAAFELAREGILPFCEAWRLVSTNPARAAGLNDRGSIAPGKRADLILVDDADSKLPRVGGVLIAGKSALICGRLLPVYNGYHSAASRTGNAHR